MAIHSESEERLSVKKRKKRAGMVEASDAPEGSPAQPAAEPPAAVGSAAITSSPKSKSTGEFTLPMSELFGTPAPDEVATTTEPASPKEDEARSLSRSLEDRVRRLEDAVAALLDNRAPEAHAVNPPTAKPVSLAAAAPASSRSQPWLGLEILVEARAMVRMYVDPRYRLTWQTRLLPPLLILGMVFSWWTIGALPLIGTLLDRAIDLVLAFVLYKVLSREATRYRQTSPDLPPTLRL